MRTLNVVLACIILFMMCFVHAGWAREKMLTTQELLDKGKDAAQKKDWPQAINYYTQAQKKAYLSPQIMYNLAVVHSRAGNELLANVWFRAYLGAVPEAANAGQVKAEIARLEKTTEDKMKRLFQQAEQLAEQLPTAGETSDSKGRRATAFEDIAAHRVMVGDFTGADEDLVKMKQVAVGGYKGTSTWEDIDTRNEIFSGILADAGDIDGAMLISEKIKNEKKKNEYCCKGLTEKILMITVRSGDLEGAKKILEKYTPESYKTSEIAKTFAMKGDFTTAENLAKRLKEPDSWLYIYLAELQLSRGNISEAKRYACACPDPEPAEAMIIKGEVETAFQELDNIKMGAFSTIGGVCSSFNDITKDLIYLGDMENAERSAKLCTEWIASSKKRHISYPSEEKYALSDKEKECGNGYAQLGKAYLDVENGKANDALKRIEKGSHLAAIFKTSKAEKEAEIEAKDFEWRCNICDFAISRGKPEAAERIADSFIQSREKIEFLKRILDVYESKKDAANAERLKQKIASLMAEVRVGWDQQNPRREVVVNAWIDAANDLSKELAVRDLQTYFSEVVKNSVQDEYVSWGPYWRVSIAAENIGKGLFKIRAMNKVYR
ncbi:MAG: tetratricopeptide repeat protein [Chloroflexi bacterium]|nr:tetratricopeptide repeat protein [Chloroflexota bacterium]